MKVNNNKLRSLDTLPKRIAFISNQAFSLINFRGDLIRAMRRQGIVIYAFAPDFDEASRDQLVALGAIPVDYSMSRTGLNPFRDGADIFKLVFQLRRLNIDASFGYFIKPVIYGTLAARLAGVSKRFAMIEGAGYIFIDEKLPFRRIVLQRLVELMYRLALSQAHCVFLLNRDDRDLFVNRRMASLEKVRLLDGIGLDLQHFNVMPPPQGPVTFILVARLLREKGVFEYINAARDVKKCHPSVRFLLVGSVDLNPGSIDPSQLTKWVKEGIVEWPGQVKDVRPWIARASVFVLPSYREGMPRSTQEAMAMGRPIITTNVPGCRDTVEVGTNGFIVPARDSAALAEAMTKFIESPELVVSMGASSRTIAEKRFDVNKINAQIMKTLLLASST